LRLKDPNFPKLVEVSPGKSGVFEDASDAYIASRPLRRPPQPLPLEVAAPPVVDDGKPRRRRKRPDDGSPP
jgi:hypothetical protein